MSLFHSCVVVGSHCFAWQFPAFVCQEVGYHCTVTIGCLVPNVLSWWFASCTRCSRSCSLDSTSYKCNACSSTSFRFKYVHVLFWSMVFYSLQVTNMFVLFSLCRYKICFIALDGTDEAEMICLGDVARQIIGKPVQQLLRTTTTASPLPADVTKIVSIRL